MTSLQQIQANRINSGKSTGPRTAAGKVKAGRNALRHGLAALMSRVPVRSPVLDSFARELCCGDEDAGVFAIAFAVAHNEIFLQKIREEQMFILESGEATADPEKAVAALKRLERYERRVWANQKGQLRQLALLIGQ
jgi:hypothetical protein